MPGERLDRGAKRTPEAPTEAPESLANRVEAAAPAKIYEGIRGPDRRDTAERDLARSLVEGAPDLVASSWRAALMPGGARLMARELQIRDRRDAEGVAADVEALTGPNTSFLSSLREKIRLAVELAVFRIARRLVLKIAGVEAARQREISRQAHR